MKHSTNSALGSTRIFTSGSASTDRINLHPLLFSEVPMTQCMILNARNCVQSIRIRCVKYLFVCGPGLLRRLGVCAFVLCFISLTGANQFYPPLKDSVIRREKQTPFDPSGKYETVAIRARVLRWVIGDNTGANILIGGELGFFKRHSVSIDFVRAVSNENLDAYYRNDSTIRPIRERNKTGSEFHFAYNYHLSTPNLRENLGLSFYTGINYRIGKWNMESDSAMYVNDHTISSSRKYYSFGPQIGALWNIGKSKRFALNLNVTTFYNVKNVTTTELVGNETYTQASVFKTVDFRVGCNLYFWLKYRKK